VVTGIGNSHLISKH